MKKRDLLVGAGVLAMGVMSISPICAASTEVTVGVAEAAPKVVTVDVPTNFAMAVVADQTKTDQTPELLMGSTTTTMGGAPTLDFINRGDTPAKITKATINNVVNSGWVLTAAAPAKGHEMNLKLGGLALTSNVGIGGTGELTGTAIDLDANSTKQIEAVGQVGGKNSDYKNAEKDAVAYHISWVIEAK